MADRESRLQAAWGIIPAKTEIKFHHSLIIKTPTGQLLE